MKVEGGAVTNRERLMLARVRYLSTSPNFGAALVLKKLGPHTNLKTDIECL